MEGPQRRRLGGRLGEFAARWLPRGDLLDDATWTARHRGICVLLWAHVAVLPLIAVARGNSYLHGLLEVSIVGWLALAAEIRPFGRKVRAAAATWGLLTCSAIVVHLYDGLIEAHFHFFVMVAVVALYQQWLPYLLALGFVLLHHSVMEMLRPEAVYNHADAEADPLKWGLIHGGFILAESIACLVYWKASEQAIANERSLRNRAETEHRRLQEAQAAIQQLAFQDPLTGLANRRLFIDRLDAALAGGNGRHGTCAILFIDLDGFKQINDLHGHAAGDAMLREVGRRIQQVVPDGDVVARFGGDEFAVLCHQADATAVAGTARRIEGLLEQPALIEGHSIRVGVSTGYAVATLDSSADILLRRADAGMYAAKAGHASTTPQRRDSGPISRRRLPDGP